MGRSGGEEFIILSPNAGLNGAIPYAQRLNDQLEPGPVESERGDFRLTIRMGLAELNAETHNLAALIDWADQALYRAKQSGRNRVAT